MGITTAEFRADDQEVLKGTTRGVEEGKRADSLNAAVLCTCCPNAGMTARIMMVEAGP
jgi:hypothetical protein